MNITAIHGQRHKGVTYGLTQKIINNLSDENTNVKEFFLPDDGPSFCIGCFSCFLRGEDKCPGADKVQPIAKALDWADVIILDSPNYVMEMSGAMKSLMDHFAYRWVTHRPSQMMFGKIGITISSSAGAPANHTVKSMASQLKWMCVSKVYTLPFICNCMSEADMSAKKRAEMERRANAVASKVKKSFAHQNVSLYTKALFSIFRGMQKAPGAAWNPMDRDWWINHGWTENVRPWKKTPYTTSTNNYEDYHIRMAKSEDETEITSLYKKIVGTPGCTWNELYPSEEEVRNDTANNSLYILTDSSDKIIGAAFAGVCDELNGLVWSTKIKTPCNLARIGISPSHQGKGLAEYLLRYIISDVKQRGFDGIRLLVSKNNSQAVALYKKTDFISCGETEMYGSDYYCEQLVFGEASVKIAAKKI